MSNILTVHIHNMKSIRDLVVHLPMSPGLYAITGQNGSGKSTLATCASRAFFNINMNDYFGMTADDAFVECEFNGIMRKWYKNSGEWAHTSNGRMEIKGFYEGSLIFGNRFRNTSFEKMKKAERVEEKKLKTADDFIRKNLGTILQGNESFYEKVWYAKGDFVGLKSGYVFYYEKNGKRISQYHMSTGESLLISILNSIFLRNSDRDRDNISIPSVFFLDEIELALHPSALTRLVVFLRKVSEKYNYAIYFSTHSIELVSCVLPTNIFYMERLPDGETLVTNPCYPAYATKFLYDQSGYDNVILVEDDLAKEIISKLLKANSLLNAKLVHVLPCGGWTNGLKLADDSLKNYLLGKRTALSVVLDKDIQKEVQKFRNKNKISPQLKVNFLPIESLEKYLRTNLVIDVDASLYRRLSDYTFQQGNLAELINRYKTTSSYNWESDNAGKRFYSILDEELSQRNVDRKDLISDVVDYISTQKQSKVEELIDFLRHQLE